MTVTALYAIHILNLRSRISMFCAVAVFSVLVLKSTSLYFIFLKMDNFRSFSHHSTLHLSFCMRACVCV